MLFDSFNVFLLLGFLLVDLFLRHGSPLQLCNDLTLELFNSCFHILLLNKEVIVGLSESLELIHYRLFRHKLVKIHLISEVVEVHSVSGFGLKLVNKECL